MSSPTPPSAPSTRPYGLFTATLLSLSTLSLALVGVSQALSAPLKIATDAQEGTTTLNAQVSQPLLSADQKQTVYLKVALKGLKPAEQQERPPLNLALVIDRSGSMSGARIQHAREAAITAIELLEPNDIISIVAYDNSAEVIVPATKVSSKGALIAKIKQIGPRGSTALHAGVKLGAQEVSKFLEKERVNRVVLLSDGIANIGPSSPSALAELGRTLVGRGMSVSTIGLGLGYNEDLMAQLALASEGNHVFVERPEQLTSIMGMELGDALAVVAKETEVTLTFADGVRPVRALGREATFKGQQVTASLGALGAHQERYLLVEAEVAATKVGATRELAYVEARYYDAINSTQRSLNATLSARAVEGEAEARASEVREVMEEVLSLIATEKQKMAVSLKDRGDSEGASRVMKQSAQLLKSAAKRYKSKKLDTLSSEAEDEAEEVKQTGADWARSRKMMRRKSHKAMSQQAY